MRCVKPSSGREREREYIYIYIYTLDRSEEDRSAEDKGEAREASMEGDGVVDLRREENAISKVRSLLYGL